MEKSSDALIVVGLAEEDVQEAMERGRALIGTQVRWFIAETEMLFGDGVGEPLFMGMDLATTPDLNAEVEIEPFKIRVLADEQLRDVKRSHPTTAGELRRAERRRRR